MDHSNETADECTVLTGVSSWPAQAAVGALYGANWAGFMVIWSEFSTL